MPDYEKRFTDLVADMENLLREATKAEPEIGEELNEKFDAGVPVLDEVQDLLAEVDEAIGDEVDEGGEDE